MYCVNILVHAPRSQSRPPHGMLLVLVQLLVLELVLELVLLGLLVFVFVIGIGIIISSSGATCTIFKTLWHYTILGSS